MKSYLCDTAKLEASMIVDPNCLNQLMSPVGAKDAIKQSRPPPSSPKYVVFTSVAFITPVVPSNNVKKTAFKQRQQQ